MLTEASVKAARIKFPKTNFKIVNKILRAACYTICVNGFSDERMATNNFSVISEISGNLAATNKTPSLQKQLYVIVQLTGSG